MDHHTILGCLLSCICSNGSNQPLETLMNLLKLFQFRKIKLIKFYLPATKWALKKHMIVYEAISFGCIFGCCRLFWFESKSRIHLKWYYSKKGDGKIICQIIYRRSITMLLQAKKFKHKYIYIFINLYCLYNYWFLKVNILFLLFNNMLALN